MRLKKSLGYFLIPAVMTMMFQACSSSKNPATPAANNGPIIVTELGENGVGGFLSVIVSDSSGNSGTANTSVTLVNNGSSIPLTFFANGPSGSITLLGAPNITGGLYTNSITYSAGQTYTFSVDVGGTVYSSTVTAIGGNPIIQPSSGSAGVTCSWSTGVGNANFIDLTNGSAQPISVIGPPIPSNPYVVPNSAFSGSETPGAGNIGVNLHIVQFKNSAFPGAQTSSCVIVNDVASAPY